MGRVARSHAEGDAVAKADDSVGGDCHRAYGQTPFCRKVRYNLIIFCLRQVTTKRNNLGYISVEEVSACIEIPAQRGASTSRNSGACILPIDVTHPVYPTGKLIVSYAEKRK